MPLSMEQYLTLSHEKWNSVGFGSFELFVLTEWIQWVSIVWYRFRDYGLHQNEVMVLKKKKNDNSIVTILRKWNGKVLLCFISQGRL